jgi:hypothetical protein
LGQAKSDGGGVIARLDNKVFPFAIRFYESFGTFGTDAFDATLSDHFFA